MENLWFINDKLLHGLKGNFDCLILFGSYSRGDYQPDSDIDILQISNLDIRSYNVGNYNISVYTVDQITQMAKEGNLFALHIIEEGKIISGNFNFINDLKKKFIRPNNYKKFRSDILLTAKLLDIRNVELYESNWKGYNGLLCFLFRSYIYSVLYEEGNLIFSISKIAKKLNDADILDLFEIKKDNTPHFLKFLKGKKLFEHYSNCHFVNDYLNPEELIYNLESKPKFLMSIGKHFLKNLLLEVDY